MTQEEIRDCVEKWKSILWLGQWHIDICYRRFENLDVYSEVEYQPQYLTAHIDFPLDALDRITEKVIIHEMIHIAISPLAYVAETCLSASEGERVLARYQKEFVTSHLTNVFSSQDFEQKSKDSPPHSANGERP